MEERYRSKEELYNENRSGAPILIIFGLVGLVLVILNVINVIKLPVSGKSLVSVVMGVLFLVFFAFGLKSLFTLKKLKPEVIKEKENIDKAIEFLKERKDAGLLDAEALEEISSEEKYLRLSSLSVKELNENFPEFEDGFSYFVVDRYAGDIFDED